MPGIFLSSSEPPQFLTEKINSSSENVVNIVVSLVEAMGFEAVFGGIFRWKVEKSARKVIEDSAKKALVEAGYPANHYSHVQAITLGSTRVALCHETYIMDGSADDDVINLELDHEREHMVGIGRIHEDNLASLMTSDICIITTTDDMMKTMYGIKHKRVQVEGEHHETVIFYDDEFQSDSVDSTDSADSDTPKNDPFAKWAAGEE